jgi:YggT family protein
MGNPFLNSVGFILGTLLNLYATVVAVRFVMQVVRADYYNPLAQAIVKITDPLLKPLRRIIPSIKRYDTASLALCFAVLLVKLMVFKALSLGVVPAMGTGIMVSQLPYAGMIIIAFLDAIHQFFNVFIFALIIMAIMSWFPGSAGNPAYGLASSIAAPALKPLQKLIPPIGGLDLTVFFTILALYAVRMFLLGTLQTVFGF